MTPFVIGASSDFFSESGTPKFPEFDLSVFRDDPDVDFRLLELGDEAPAGSLQDLDALVLLRPQITTESLQGADRLALIARFGVGYERVDVDACTAADIAVSITPQAVRRPVAVAEMTLILACAGRLIQKDAIVRRGPAAWPQRTQFNGTGLAGRILGSVGLGGIAGELMRLAAPFDLKLMGCDPHLTDTSGLPSGVEVTSLEGVLAQSDFLVINCPLTPDTKGLIGAAELSQMKPDAFLINTARGGIVDESALAKALVENRLAGAGIDVFDTEPVDLANPLLSAPNTIFTPHAIAWTDQNFAAIGESIIRSVSMVRSGKGPVELANPGVANSSGWQSKLRQPNRGSIRPE